MDQSGFVARLDEVARSMDAQESVTERWPVAVDDARLIPGVPSGIGSVEATDERAPPSPPPRGPALLAEIGIELVAIPAGSFRMGSTSSEADLDEAPVHTVQVPAFRLMKHEVTMGQYRAFVEATGHRADVEPNGDRAQGCYSETSTAGVFDHVAGRSFRDAGYRQSATHPAVCLSFEDALAFAEWLSRETGLGFRLPSEAEWEYAARAGHTGERSAPSASGMCEYASVFDEAGRAGHPTWAWPHHRCTDGFAETAPVGSFRANGFGLHDLLGNVWEWTADCWHESYEGAPTVASAWEAAGECTWRVVRGGSWFNLPANVRFANRYWFGDSFRYLALGFRLATDAVVGDATYAERPLAEPHEDARLVPPQLLPQQPTESGRLAALGIELLAIPAGSFRMGSSSSEAYPNEKPVHAVTVPAFRLMKHEVTVGQYRAFVEATGRPAATAPWFPQDDRHPVVRVNWDDAVAYAEWLSKETGMHFRLPSEAEWEYAARAGTTDERPAPPSGMCEHANVQETDYGCRDGHDYTAPVGSFRANGFGLHDMLGNAWEWTADCWHDSYAGAPTDGSAWETGGYCGRRVARGGSWFVRSTDWVRFAHRHKNRRTYRDFNLGFRLAAEP